MASTRIAKAFNRRSLTFLNHHHRLSASTQPRPVAAAIFCRQMSTDARSVAARLSSSGFIRSQGFIGGKWTDAYDGKTIEVLNPATGEVVTNVSCMGARETNDAIASAHDAFTSWSKRTAAERSKCLRKWYDLLMAHKEELGQLMTLEQGKPLKEAIGEVNYGASFVEFFAEEAKRVYGDIIPATLPDRRLFVLKQPVGVVGAITPWNFPLAMITRKVAPALACGCTVVVKPSELTPLTALAAAELAFQAGIPHGALNVVMGNASEIGDALLASPQVRKITFTGSTAVGKKLMAGAAGTVKKVSLELGGNAPCIIFDDADLDVAVKGTLASKFRNSGQTCVCANRVLVQEGIFEKFANAFSKAVESMKVGEGFAEGAIDVGPLINDAALHKVESFVQDAISKGAKVLTGGKKHSLGMTFYEPTVLTDVKSEMHLSSAEIFGPVAPLQKFKTEEEAIHRANDTNAGDFFHRLLRVRLIELLFQIHLMTCGRGSRLLFFRGCVRITRLIVKCLMAERVGPRPFRFWNMWVTHESFLSTVRESWELHIDERSQIRIAMMKLKRLKGVLREWNTHISGNFNSKICSLNINGQTIDGLLLVKSEHMKQQSRISWLNDGDRNTKTFPWEY